MSPTDREAFVKNFLKIDVMTADRLNHMTIMEDEEQAVGESMVSTSGKSMSTDGAALSMVSSVREASGFWSAVGDDVESQRFPHCAICLERLRLHDEIGLSQNDNCKHMFHSVCVTEWLMANKDCPICRRKYLDLVEM